MPRCNSSVTEWRAVPHKKSADVLSNLPCDSHDFALSSHCHACWSGGMRHVDGVESGGMQIEPAHARPAGPLQSVGAVSRSRAQPCDRDSGSAGIRTCAGRNRTCSLGGISGRCSQPKRRRGRPPHQLANGDGHPAPRPARRCALQRRAARVSAACAGAAHQPASVPEHHADAGRGRLSRRFGQSGGDRLWR